MPPPKKEDTASTAPHKPPRGRLQSLSQRALGPGVGGSVNSSSPLIPGPTAPPILPPATARPSAPRGRFAPKAVARRSKEERASTAPADKPSVVKQEPSSSSASGRGGGPGGQGRGGSTMGRGSGRGGRGRGRFQPVTHAAIGALSAPTAFDPRSYARGLQSGSLDIRGSRDNSPQTDFLAARLKSETPGLMSVGSSRSPSVDPDGMIAIDMSQNGPMAPDLSEFFPVRLERRQDDEVDAEEYEMAEAQQHEKESKRIDRRRPSAVCHAEEEQEEGLIKAEEDDVKMEEDLRKLKVSKKMDTNKKHDKVQKGLAGLAEEEASELRRIARDHKLISKEFHLDAAFENGEEVDDQSSIENRLYFFQFPVLMPSFVPAGSSSSDDDDLMEIQDPGKVDFSDSLPDGLIGKLRLHKSGKLTMVVGNIVMDVSQGTECSFLQDVVVVDQDEKRSYLVGQISKKMVLSPKYDV